MNSRLNAKITLAALAILEAQAVQLSHEDGADETGVCECLMTHDQPLNFPSDGSPYIIYTDGGVEYQYPANYGVGVCGAWDTGLEPNCAENENNYCELEWCYVSAECEASDAAVSTLNEEIKYSYATCGNVVPEEVEENNEDEAGDAEVDAEEEAGDADAEAEEEAGPEDMEADEGADEAAEEEADAEAEAEAEDDPFALDDELLDLIINGPADDEEVDETGVCECLPSSGQDIYFPADNMPYIIVTVDGEEYQYPAMYGSATCNAWDSGLEPSCADDEADFCDDAWCYVADDCEASDLTASTFIEGLSYSYRTCGVPTEAEDETAAEEEAEPTEEEETELGVCECLLTHD